MLILSRVSRFKTSQVFTSQGCKRGGRNLHSSNKPRFFLGTFFYLINQSWMFGGESNQLFLYSDRIVCIVVGWYVVVSEQRQLQCSHISVRQTLIMLPSNILPHTRQFSSPLTRYSDTGRGRLTSPPASKNINFKKCSRFGRLLDFVDITANIYIIIFKTRLGLLKRNVFNNKFTNVCY